MENFSINAVGATILSACTYIFGGWGKLLPLLVILATLDILGGLMAAFNHSNYNSVIFKKGILKKLYMFIVIAAAYQVGGVVGFPFLREAFISYYAAGEAISIIKNSAEFGLAYPEKIMEFLEKFKDKINNTPPDNKGE